MSRRVRPGAGRFASAASGSAARRSVRGALTLGLVAMSVLVTSCATPGAPATEGELSEDELLVMSFNIRMIYDNEGERTRWIGRRADVVEFIRRARATIVTLQEVETRAREPMPRSEQLSYLQGELPEYAFACIPEPGVLSRQPILYDATRLRLLDEGMVLDAPIERYREGFRGRIASWALFAIDAPQGERLVRVI
ncbi:MAG: endonuclease/exonuclease/phosphatase family protein, partial [Spirochaetota bacterium]